MNRELIEEVLAGICFIGILIIAIAITGILQGNI